MVIYALMIAHLLADFYFQPNSLAEGKSKSIPSALLHFAIYAVTLGIPLALFAAPDQIWKSLLVIAGSHILVDSVRILIERNTKQKYPIVLFAIDQTLHLLVIFFVYRIFMQSTFFNVSSFVYGISSINAINLNNSLLYTLIFLIVLLPDAILVRKLLQSLPQQKQPKLKSHERAKSAHKALVQNARKYSEGMIVRSYVKKSLVTPVPSAEDTQEQNMGLIIGMLERILVAAFILVGQYTAIAFVITSKSIARFKQLEDQAFAEKYLIGTLSSVALSMLTTALLSSFLMVNP